MNFAIYVPDNVDGRQMPVLYYLSGVSHYLLFRLSPGTRTMQV
jgi:hypothetical protein